MKKYVGLIITVLSFSKNMQSMEELATKILAEKLRSTRGFTATQAIAAHNGVIMVAKKNEIINFGSFLAIPKQQEIKSYPTLTGQELETLKFEFICGTLNTEKTAQLRQSMPDGLGGLLLLKRTQNGNKRLSDQEELEIEQYEAVLSKRYAKSS